MEHQIQMEETVRRNNHNQETVINHKATRSSQHDKILALLRSYHGEWCPLPEILKLMISQYGRAVNDLRKMGYVIENKTQWEGRTRKSWFKIIE